MASKKLSLKKAVEVAALAMTLQRQTYNFDNSMYNRGLYNAKTMNANQKFTQLSESIELFRGLVTVPPEQPAPGDTILVIHSEPS